MGKDKVKDTTPESLIREEHWLNHAESGIETLIQKMENKKDEMVHTSLLHKSQVINIIPESEYLGIYSNKGYFKY
jgi:hypothetical protein